MILPFDDLSCLQFCFWDITPPAHGLMNHSKPSKLFTNLILSNTSLLQYSLKNCSR